MKPPWLCRRRNEASVGKYLMKLPWLREEGKSLEAALALLNDEAALALLKKE